MWGFGAWLLAALGLRVRGRAVPGWGGGGGGGQTGRAGVGGWLVAGPAGTGLSAGTEDTRHALHTAGWTEKGRRERYVHTGVLEPSYTCGGVNT